MKEGSIAHGRIAPGPAADSDSAATAATSTTVTTAAYSAAYASACSVDSPDSDSPVVHIAWLFYFPLVGFIVNSPGSILTTAFSAILGSYIYKPSS